MQPEFSRAAVASFIASIVRGVTTFAEEIERTGREPTQPPPEAQPRASPLAVTMLSQVLDADLDQWETNVLATAPPRLLAEFQDIRWMFRETAQHSLSFGPSHDQPH